MPSLRAPAPQKSASLPFSGLGNACSCCHQTVRRERGSVQQIVTRLHETTRSSRQPKHSAGRHVSSLIHQPFSLRRNHDGRKSASAAASDSRIHGTLAEVLVVHQPFETVMLKQAVLTLRELQTPQTRRSVTLSETAVSLGNVRIVSQRFPKTKTPASAGESGRNRTRTFPKTHAGNAGFRFARQQIRQHRGRCGTR